MNVRRCSICNTYYDSGGHECTKAWCSICDYALPGCACAIKKSDLQPVILPKPEKLKSEPPKLEWHHTPQWFLKPVAMVGQMGAGKYGALDYLKNPSAVTKHMNSLKRHLEELENPNRPDVDEESQINHAAHIAWRALALYHVLTTRPDLDDRYKV